MKNDWRCKRNLKNVILFDLLNAQPMGESKFHGGGEYIKSIFKCLVESMDSKTKLIVFYDFGRYLDEWILSYISVYKITAIDIKRIQELESVFRQYNVNIFYTGMPYGYSKKILPDNVYKIGTFHGLRAIECPTDSFEYKYSKSIKEFMKSRIKGLIGRRLYVNFLKNKGYGLDCFDEIITVSYHSYYSLKKNFHLKNKIGVFYSPQKKCCLCENVIDENYILIISANRWIKNAYRGLMAIDDLYTHGLLKNIRTIVVGEISNRIKKEIKNDECFTLKSYVSSSELEMLYAGCKVFLYPTLNEGFGYPPLEAMKYGKTCVVSAVCSLPEICGDAVYYINPYDMGEISTRILEACENPIDENIVYKQVKKIEKKENDDLKLLVEKILACRNI